MKKKISLIAAALGILCIAIIAGASIFFKGGASKPLDSKIKISFKIDAPDYSEDTDSKFPIEIAGTDNSGASVKQTVYITISDNTVEMPKGSYTAHAVASPLLKSGALYALPEDTEIKGDETEPVALSYEKKPQDEITKEDISAAKQAALDSGMSEDTVEALAEPVITTFKTAQLGALGAYESILNDLVALKEGKETDGSIILSHYPHETDYLNKISACLFDVNNDGVDELFVGTSEQINDFTSITYSQLYGIKDGKPTLLLGNSKDDPDKQNIVLNVLSNSFVTTGRPYDYDFDVYYYQLGEDMNLTLVGNTIGHDGDYIPFHDEATGQTKQILAVNFESFSNQYLGIHVDTTPVDPKTLLDQLQEKKDSIDID